VLAWLLIRSAPKSQRDRLDSQPQTSRIPTEEAAAHFSFFFWQTTAESAPAPPWATSWWKPTRAISMRAGYATTAGENDEPGYRIRQRMRHKSTDTTGGYIPAGQQWSKSGLKGSDSNPSPALEYDLLQGRLTP
jgi:hypothetical protein